ncbi:MAG TPA: SLAP domain-containing protein [Staphylococcus sp.]|nr:SLAP domain-containing protein [Staphylococcus sp.]
MNKLVKCSAAALLAASLFGFGGQFVNAATGYQRLTHNAYAYTYNGKSANAKLYKKGSKVKVIGSIKLKNTTLLVAMFILRLLTLLNADHAMYWAMAMRHNFYTILTFIMQKANVLKVQNYARAIA